MSTRDLTYLIDFDVSDSSSLTTAADDMEKLATKASELEQAPAIDLDLGTIETAPEDIGAVGDALDDLPIEDANSRWGGLSDVLGQFGLTSLGVGEAIEIAGTAIEAGRQAWSYFTADARAAEQRTREFFAALLETSGLMDSIEGTFQGKTDPFSAFTSALTDLDDVDLGSIVASMGDMGLQADQLGETLVRIGTSDNAVQTFYDMASAASIATDSFGVTELGSTRLMNVVGDLTDEQQRFVDGYNTMAASLDGLDFGDIAEKQLEIAEGYDAMSVAQARSELGPDASDVDVWVRYQEIVSEAAVANEEAADTAQALAEQQEATTAGARELADALGSIDWQEAEVAGATSAMASYTDGMFAVDNATQSVEEAFAKFAAAVGDGALNLDVTTEAGRRQQDALEGIANALDTQFVQAFDAANGSQEAFMASATEIGDATLARLADQLNLSTDQVDQLREALGLTEGDYEARFQLSADETAIERLQLLQGAIAGLPTEVQTTVNTYIANGDPQAALQEIMDFYADPANVAQVQTVVDPTGAQAGVAAVTDGEYKVEFSTEAPNAEDTADELDDVAEDRETTVTAEASTSKANEVISAFEALDRTVSTYLSLVNGSAFDTVIDNHTDDRKIKVNLDVGTIDLPSASELAGRIGTVRVPVVPYMSSKRVNGARS